MLRMTIPTTLLSDIGWTIPRFAAHARVPFRTARSWFARDNMPAAYVEWLADVRDAIRSVPPPDRSAYRVRRIGKGIGDE